MSETDPFAAGGAGVSSNPKTAPADGIVKTGIEAPADGTVVALTAPESPAEGSEAPPAPDADVVPHEDAEGAVGGV